MNHQGLLWNVHYVATIVVRKEIGFQSSVIRSKRSSCYSSSETHMCSLDHNTYTHTAHAHPLINISAYHYMTGLCRRVSNWRRLTMVHFTRPAVVSGVNTGSFAETADGNRAYGFVPGNLVSK